VVKASREPELEQHCPPDSSGSRPGQSALAAVGVARQRCWRYNGVLHLDLQAFCATMPHDLLLRAVRSQPDGRWVLLSMERGLNAPVQLPDGPRAPREQGAPQGAVGSPVLANLFVHSAFDRWMATHYPCIPCERYADDILCHWRSETQAREVWTGLEQRCADCGLRGHPDKTTVVYCQEEDRRGQSPNEQCDCLGDTFRPRRSKHRWGKYCVNCSPGISNTAAQAIRQTSRGWQLDCRMDKKGDALARMFNPVMQGGITDDGRYYQSALYPPLRSLDRRLVRGAMAKYQRLRRHRRRSEHWIRRVAGQSPKRCAHWRVLHRAVAGQ
jgi:RNA-directed DNA polymerase